VNETQQQHQDEHLRRLFREALPALPDAGFSDGIVRRIRRKLRIRRAVLLGAAGLGAVIAAWPAGQFLLWIGNAMATTLAESGELNLGQYQSLGLVVVLAMLSPLLVNLLED
jgi:hypothetical protein